MAPAFIYTCKVISGEGELLWEYLNPYRGTIHHPDGDPVTHPFAYWQFRANIIPADHPGLKGKALVPLDSQPAVFKLPPKPGKD
jgi:hypothetical protein